MTNKDKFIEVFGFEPDTETMIPVCPPRGVECPFMDDGIYSECHCELWWGREYKALEQEAQTFKWCIDCKEYDQEKHCCHRWSKVIRDTVEEMKQEYIERDVLDKIREQIMSNLKGVDIALEVLGENHPLRQKMEGAKDTLVDCLELIDKAETEE